MKNKWTRLIAAVLTLAMAFSICAVPASAASDGNTYTDEEAKAAKALIRQIDDGTSMGYALYWIKTRELIMEAEEADTDDAWVKKVNELNSSEGWTIYEGDVPTGALSGYLNGDTNQIIWFDQTDREKIEEIEDNLGDDEEIVFFYWNIGWIVINDTTIETLTARLNAANQTGTSGNNTQAATEENAWAYGGMTSDMNGTCYEWGSEALVRDLIISLWNKQYASTYGTLTETTLAAALANAKKELAARYEIYEGTLPSNAYLGYSQTKGGKIYWYTKTDLVNAETKQFSVDWNTGTVTYTVNGTEKQIEAINKASASTNSSSSGSSSDSGAVILLAGGAVVVAGVGLYLYTHPAVVQQIKNFFTGNSAAKAAAESTEAAAESAGETAAENTVELPAEADAAA
jgi:hypothetical protein